MTWLRAEFGTLLELVVTLSVYGFALLVGALWLGVGIRVVRAVAGF